MSGSSFLDEKVSNIHFNAGGNDFGGMILWQDTYGETKTLQISGQNTTGDCRLRVEGLYYNAERGERLRPLDEKTRARFFASELNADDLAGGLYTDCTGAVLTADPRSMGVYGYLTHTYKNKTYGLIAGLKYTLSANSAGSPQSP
ncbi:MAG: hypothetical protein LBG52_04885 [Candidatus Peribacteria bacterium]|nr:hypothetical protein [Candidatus Peribacteria bacterium]